MCICFLLLCYPMEEPSLPFHLFVGWPPCHGLEWCRLMWRPPITSALSGRWDLCGKLVSSTSWNWWALASERHSASISKMESDWERLQYQSGASMCTYVHSHAHTHVCTGVRTLCISTCTYMHLHPHTCIYTGVSVHMHSHMRNHMHIHVFTPSHMHLHRCKQAHAYPRAHTCIHTLIHASALV